MAGRSKTDSRYWLESERLFKDRSPDYSCRIAYKGRRERFCLGTPNKKEAAAKAAKIYSHLVAHGWESTRQEHKMVAAAAATVGDLISKSLALSTARASSLEAYAKAFRRIVSEIEKLDSDDKFDAIKGGNAKWRSRVDAVPLSSLPPRRIVAWKNLKIRESEKNPVAKAKAIVTVNSLIRNARSLFSKKILSFLRTELELPDELPFDGVSLEKSPSLRYRSTIDAAEVLAHGRNELMTGDPEAYKVLILALICGLRRSEIDSLLWERFDFGRQILSIESSEYHELKSEDSRGQIDLDEETTNLFKRYREKELSDEFVVRSPYLPVNQRSSRSYRAEAVFNRLTKWLRNHGITSDKPIHTLRKEIGSIIADQYGIFQASRYLRHSDIRITAAFYADKKQAVVPVIKPNLTAGTTRED